ncbi:hypothetical protein ACFSC3_04770 [Sphingomonas floccifaciens]|uniref:Outer membrane lipoprotein n=1 Tax=Sphingomonas floccifaciens TaxID=1844115 RepID=A0ABW4NC41_9SPHN
MRFFFPLAALALTAGCVATPQETAREQARQDRDLARLDRDLRGWSPGRPQTCVQTRNANVRIYGDTLVYDDGGRRYLTKTGGGCFGLQRDDIIVTQSFMSQMCRGDIVRTVDRTAGFPSGACSFGDFVPYTKNGR